MDNDIKPWDIATEEIKPQPIKIIQLTVGNYCLIGLDQDGSVWQSRSTDNKYGAWKLIIPTTTPLTIEKHDL